HGSTGGSYASATATTSAAATATSGNTGGTGGTGGTGAIPSDTGVATANGCPAQPPPSATTSPSPDVVVTQSSGLDQQITLKQGQTVEIRLNPALRWSLTMTASSQLLAPTQPNGWYNTAENACVWRFIASATGSTTLAFSGMAICQGGAICPHVAFEQDYAVTVS
ncbi:MAG: hypothetical protein ACRDHE_05470, partial [Ktedonobacterales bacterium]